LQGHDDVADVIKDDIWPDPLRWFREYEESVEQALFEEEGEDDGEVEEEGEEEYEVDGEEGVEYGQGAGEFTV
jgi:template-activating factor I